MIGLQVIEFPFIFVGVLSKPMFTGQAVFRPQDFVF